MRALTTHVYFLAASVVLVVGGYAHAQEVPAAQEEMPVPAQLAEPEAVQEVVDLRQGSAPERYVSAMFYDEELKQIRTVIQAIKQDQPLPEEDKKSTTSEPSTPKPVLSSYTYPQFYLTSIVYRGPDSWVVWINHKKITTQKQNVIPGLTVDRVTRDLAELTYDFASDANINAQTQTADSRISIEQNQRRTSFRLEPNQTFSTYSWQIYEGYIAPAQLASTSSKNAESTSLGISGIDDILGPSDEPKAIHNEEGASDIGGILNEYKQIDERF